MNKKFVYNIWSEWDINHQKFIFESREKALAWLQENVYLLEVMESEGCSLNDLINESLIIIQSKEFI